MKQKHYLLFLGGLFFLSVALLLIKIDRKHIWADEAGSTPAGTDVFVDEIKVIIAHARAKLMALKDFLSVIKPPLASAFYNSSSKISFIDSQGDGIIVDFAYSGGGAVEEGFAPLDATLVIKDLPAEWHEVVKKALDNLGLDSLLHVSPAQVWIFKMLLLIKDRTHNLVSHFEFLKQALILLHRLVITPGMDSFEKVIASISPLVSASLANITFKGSPSEMVLSNYFSIMRHALVTPFSKHIVNGMIINNPSYAFNTSLISDVQARERLFSLSFKSVIFYIQLQESFNKTPAGKTAYKAVQDATPSTILSAVSSYNSVLPQYSELKGFIVVELAHILVHMQNPTYKTVLGKMVDPILGILGLTFTSLLEGVAGVKIGPEAPTKEALPDFKIDEVNVDAFEPDNF